MNVQASRSTSAEIRETAVRSSGVTKTHETGTRQGAVAGVARSNLPQGSASTTKSYARSKAYATSANLYPPTS